MSDIEEQLLTGLIKQLGTASKDQVGNGLIKQLGTACKNQLGNGFEYQSDFDIDGQLCIALDEKSNTSSMIRW